MNFYTGNFVTMSATMRLLLFIGTAICLDVVPESVKMIYTNVKYVENVTANIRRYKRNSPYYFNLYGDIKHTWANNVTVHIILTEFLHNEYRRSFIEFHYKFCDFINGEPYIGGMFSKRGIVCPAPKGRYEIQNMTVQSTGFPNVWPFEKGGADILVSITETGELIGKSEMHMKFIQKKIVKKPSN